MEYQEIATGVQMPMLGFGTFLNTGKKAYSSKDNRKISETKLFNFVSLILFYLF